MNLILLGPPGAGKGTLAGNLSKRLSIPTISTGNILREAIKNNTELGKNAKSFMDAGKLVPDEVVIGMIKERFARPDCQQGFILDGFPRTIDQAEALDAICDIDIALGLEVDDKIIEERMTGRRSCVSCGATYHIVNNPPKKQDVCDDCSAELTIRSDDKAEVVIDRLKTYHTVTKPLVAYYRGQRKFRKIIAETTIEHVMGEALKILEIK